MFDNYEELLEAKIYEQDENIRKLEEEKERISKGKLEVENALEEKSVNEISLFFDNLNFLLL